MDALTESALSLGSQHVSVITREDMDRIGAIFFRLGEEGLLTEPERFAIELIRVREWTCPDAEKVTV